MLYPPKCLRDAYLFLGLPCEFSNPRSTNPRKARGGWGWVVDASPQPLYNLLIESWFPFFLKLGGPRTSLDGLFTSMCNGYLTFKNYARLNKRLAITATTTFINLSAVLDTFCSCLVSLSRPIQKYFLQTTPRCVHKEFLSELFWTLSIILRILTHNKTVTLGLLSQTAQCTCRQYRYI